MLHIWTISFIMIRSHLHTLFSDFASILLKILASTSTRFDNAESMSPHQQDIYQMLVEDLGHPGRSEEPPNNWVGCGGGGSDLGGEVEAGGRGRHTRGAAGRRERFTHLKRHIYLPGSAGTRSDLRGWGSGKHI